MGCCTNSIGATTHGVLETNSTVKASSWMETHREPLHQGAYIQRLAVYLQNLHIKRKTFHD